MDDLGTGWKHDGDGWRIDVGGACPVQGYGNVDGLPVYFRARGEGWAFRVAASADGNPVLVDMGERGYIASGYYGDWPDAGWMQRPHSRAIVVACVAAFRAARAAGRAPSDAEPVIEIDVSGVPTAPEPRDA